MGNHDPYSDSVYLGTLSFEREIDKKNKTQPDSGRRFHNCRDAILAYFCGGGVLTAVSARLLNPGVAFPRVYRRLILKDLLGSFVDPLAF